MSSTIEIRHEQDLEMHVNVDRTIHLASAGISVHITFPLGHHAEAAAEFETVTQYLLDRLRGAK